MKSKTRIYEMHYLNLYIGTGTIQQLADLAGKTHCYIFSRMKGEIKDSVDYMFYDVTDKIEYNVYRGVFLVETLTKKEIMDKYILSNVRFGALNNPCQRKMALESMHAENFDKARLWIERAPYKQLIPIQKGEMNYA